jgi:hypothetical protein
MAEIRNDGITQEELIKRNPFNIKLIHEPSEELQLLVIDQNTFAIHYIKNPSLRIIEYTINKTSEIHRLKSFITDSSKLFKTKVWIPNLTQ